MTINETLTMTALLLAPAFFSLLGMAAFGSPVVAVLGEIAAKTKSKVFYDKYGQQTASMGLVLLILILIIQAAAIGVAYTKFPQLIQQFFTPETPLLNAFIAFGAFIVFALPYLTLWKKMRQSKGFHMFLGVVAALASICLVALGVPAKLMATLPTETVQEQLALGVQSMFLPMAIMYTLLTIVAAAGLSCAYLVMRRNKDDFGRDYYKFSLPLAARWATIPMFGFLACQGWLFTTLSENFKALVLDTPLGYIWAAGCALGLICAILWILIARSEKPLQLKGLAFLNCVLMWLMHTANATLFVNFMSMF